MDNGYNRELIVQWLTNFVIELIFRKADGSDRKMVCTLRSDLLPEREGDKEVNKDRQPNPNLISVWDMEKEGWRSFRVDTVVPNSIRLRT